MTSLLVRRPGATTAPVPSMTRLPRRRPARLFRRGHAPWPQAWGRSSLSAATVLPLRNPWIGRWD